MAACLLRMRLMLRVMSLFFKLQLRRNLRIFLPAASANLVKFLDEAVANWVVPYNCNEDGEYSHDHHVHQLVLSAVGLLHV
jgi:hypothetical protein